MVEMVEIKMKFNLELDIFDELVDDLKVFANKRNITWQELLTENITPIMIFGLSEDLDNHIIEEIMPYLQELEGESDEEGSC
jgi:hypothetical protein